MNRSNLFVGLVLIAIGTLFLLDQLEVVEAWPLIVEWWPSVVIVAGLSQLATRPRNPVGALTIAAIGGVLLLWTLGLVDGIGLLWPVLLIALGLWLVVGRRSVRAARRGEGVEVLALFGDHREAVAGGFAGGEVVTLFGDAALDLRDTEPSDTELALQVTTVFGDVALTVPQTWDVRVSGPEIFGDVTLTGATEGRAPAAVLRLHVVTVFGDIDIRTVAARSADAPPSA